MQRFSITDNFGKTKWSKAYALLQNIGMLWLLLQSVDALTGADFDAFTTGSTFVVVDDRVVIDHVNRIMGTDFFAFAAANTAVFAYADGFLGVEVAGTDHFNRLTFVKDADEIIGTGFLTHAAAGAFLPVDDGYAVDDVDCFKLTGFDAVSQP